jgi:hypothetical protein
VGAKTGYRFNEQDKSMVGDSTDFDKHHNGNPPTPLYRPDAFQLAWRKMCNERARGEGLLAQRAQEEAASSIPG